MYTTYTAGPPNMAPTTRRACGHLGAASPSQELGAEHELRRAAALARGWVEGEAKGQEVYSQ
jgi:hypothetical protein